MARKNAENASPPWSPTRVVRFEEAFDTSMGTAKIVTDAGPAFIKALRSTESPHLLACELVASRLAKWFGLATPDIATLTIDAAKTAIPLASGGFAMSGTAFVSRALLGLTWGGTSEELSDLVNPYDVGRLVVFDTWVLNCDRHSTARRPNLGNVFIEVISAGRRAKKRLIALDHSHCFTCGSELNRKAGEISRVKDDRLYGCFPGFTPSVRDEDIQSSVVRLQDMNTELAETVVNEIPPDWQVDQSARAALVQLIVRRAEFVSSTIMDLVAKTCWPGRLFDYR